MRRLEVRSNLLTWRCIRCLQRTRPQKVRSKKEGAQVMGWYYRGQVRKRVHRCLVGIVGGRFGAELRTQRTQNHEHTTQNPKDPTSPMQSSVLCAARPSRAGTTDDAVTTVFPCLFSEEHMHRRYLPVFEVSHTAKTQGRFSSPSVQLLHPRPRFKKVSGCVRRRVSQVGRTGRQCRLEEWL